MGMERRAHTHGYRVVFRTRRLKMQVRSEGNREGKSEAPRCETQQHVVPASLAFYLAQHYLLRSYLKYYPTSLDSSNGQLLLERLSFIQLFLKYVTSEVGRLLSYPISRLYSVHIVTVAHIHIPIPIILAKLSIPSWVYYARRHTRPGNSASGAIPFAHCRYQVRCSGLGRAA